MELFEWMTSTTWGESLLTLLVSMVPVIELRGGVPFGTALVLCFTEIDVFFMKWMSFCK